MDINKEIAYKASDADRMIYRVLPRKKLSEDSISGNEL